MYNEKYGNWIIIGNNWIDFVTAEYYDVELIDNDDKTITARVYFNNAVDKIEYSSIGELNCMSGNFELETIQRPVIFNETNYLNMYSCSEQTTTTGDTFLYMFFVSCPFLLLIFVNKYYRKQKLLIAIIGVFMIIISFSLMSCAVLLTIMYLTIGLVVMLTALL